jgi:glucose-6-phosphate isomerase
MEINETAVKLDLAVGKLEGKSVLISRTLYKDVVSCYQKPDPQLSLDTVMYEVYRQDCGNENDGELNFGVSVLKPVLVSGQANMTRGHYHANRNCAEYYFGISGEGLLLLMDTQGHCRIEKVGRGSLHHIDGHLAHRLVNIGNQDLSVGCIWPANSGHDYESVVRQPFTCRIFIQDGKLKVEEDHQ